MAADKPKQKQPTAEVAKYKVAYFADDPKLLSAKMFKDLGEAKTFADGHQNSLITELKNVNGGEYEWAVIPGGRSTAAYSSMTFIYQYRWWILLTLAGIAAWFIWGKMKGKLSFGNGGQAPAPAPAPMPTPSPVAATPAAPAVDAGGAA